MIASVVVEHLFGDSSSDDSSAAVTRDDVEGSSGIMSISLLCTNEQLFLIQRK